MSTLTVRRPAASTNLIALSVGVIAATAASLMLFMLRTVFGGPSLFEVVSEGVIQLLPGAMFSAALEQLQFTGKPLLFTLVQIGSLAAGGILGLYYVTKLGEVVPNVTSSWLASDRGKHVGHVENMGSSESDEVRYPLRKALVFGLLLFVVLGVVFLPLMGAGLFGVSRTSDVPLWLAMLLAVATYTIAVRIGAGRASGFAATAALPDSSANMSPTMTRRRAAVNALAGGAVLSVGSLFAWSALRTSPATGVESGANSGLIVSTKDQGAGPQLDNGHPTSEITKVGTFYNVSKNFIDPIVTDANWKVQIVGHVDNPFSIGLDELKALPPIERQHTLGCISNEVGGDLIGNGQWRGVRFADLLDQAGIKQGARKVIFHCRDDYRDSITVEAARNPDTLLAYEMNGAPLTNKHGFPARLLIPGIYGMKNVKWLDKVEIAPSPFLGFWQSQGWSDPAPYLTMSRIDWPTRAGLRFDSKPTTIYGVAYAGDRGIAQVEITVDGGAIWQPAKIVSGGQPNVWARWAFDWTPEAGRQAIVKVRATDRQGQKQIETAHAPFPDGATGYHSITISVANA